jgi:hypothetical protein
MLKIDQWLARTAMSACTARVGLTVINNRAVTRTHLE